MKPLRVNVTALQRLSGQFDGLATRLGNATTSSPGTGVSSWQSSVAESATARSAATRQQTVFASRIRATAEKIATAGSAYRRSDDGSATALTGQMV